MTEYIYKLFSNLSITNSNTQKYTIDAPYSTIDIDQAYNNIRYNVKSKITIGNINIFQNFIKKYTEYCCRSIHIIDKNGKVKDSYIGEDNAYINISLLNNFQNISINYLTKLIDKKYNIEIVLKDNDNYMQINITIHNANNIYCEINENGMFYGDSEKNLQQFTDTLIKDCFNLSNFV